ncbi:phage holin family protein [Novosphingobium aquiterrae]|uniref:Phage holin family protein n=1 Tax=Novosphingobium aquiterrae TaxID=624388 RepID=A0ABV6PHL1_9SPHN
MADEPLSTVTPSTSDAAERSLVDDVRDVVADGRTLLEAELAYQKSRAAVAGSGAKGVAAWGALALALVFFALMALVLGLVLALTALIGPTLATLVSVLALLIAAALCGWTAARRWKRTSQLLSGTDDAP